jgi:putative FmdB family regulatory protein
MPTYVYECSNCSDVFEVEQRITESALTACHCGSEGTVKRLIQPAGIMFKGSGFHINDYSSAGESKPSTPSAPAAESKPAADPPACSGDQSSCKVCGDT